MPENPDPITKADKNEILKKVLQKTDEIYQSAVVKAEENEAEKMLAEELNQ